MGRDGEERRRRLWRRDVDGREEEEGMACKKGQSEERGWSRQSRLYVEEHHLQSVFYRRW